MDESKLIHSGIWISVMPTYLLGGFMPDDVSDMQATPAMWFGMAVLMVIPTVTKM